MKAYTLVVISLYTAAIKKENLENSFLLRLSVHDLLRNLLLSLLFYACHTKGPLGSEESVAWQSLNWEKHPLNSVPEVNLKQVLESKESFHFSTKTDYSPSSNSLG